MRNSIDTVRADSTVWTHHLADCVRLTKPRLTLMAAATTLLGFRMASESALDTRLLLDALFGSILVGGGASTLNQYLEKEADGCMKRTEQRPLPSGRLKEETALGLGVLLAAVGLCHLLVFVNPLTALIGFLAGASYLFCYTPLKKRTVLNTFVGAATGALPALMGWTAAADALAAEAWVLFAILYLWQLPHFFSIAWVYKDDYAKSGFRMMTLHDENGGTTWFQIALFCLLLLAASLIPWMLQMAGRGYLWAVLPCGIALFAFAVRCASHRFRAAKPFIPASIAYLGIVILSMMADKI